jgi:hypothetical protein
MLHRNGKKIYGSCPHSRGLIDKKCVDCGQKVNLRRYIKEKAFVDEETIIDYLKD